jgi:hypothetical protein
MVSSRLGLVQRRKSYEVTLGAIRTGLLLTLYCKLLQSIAIRTLGADNEALSPIIPQRVF